MLFPSIETDSGFSFKPPGKIVEYAVKMKELPHGCFLNELVEKNRVGEKEIDRVISHLASVLSGGNSDDLRSSSGAHSKS